MRNKDRMLENRLFIFFLGLLILSAVFMLIGMNKNNMRYLMETRYIKLLAIFLSGASVAISTMLFQTVTGSRILTPSVMGLDAMYVFLQTMIIFLFKRIMPMLNESIPKFFLTIFLMLGITMFMQRFFKGNAKKKILYLILIGMVGGTFLDSLSNAMQLLMDPNEFLILQGSLFASYSKVNPILLGISYGIFFLVLMGIRKDMPKLDVLALGYEQSINLGLDYNRLLRKFLIVIGILVSISTALVGPMTFLGLLGVNIAKEMFKTYKHRFLMTGAVIISCSFLLMGQLAVDKIFNNSFAVSTVINFVGGLYLLYILLKERKIV